MASQGDNTMDNSIRAPLAPTNTTTTTTTTTNTTATSTTITTITTITTVTTTSPGSSDVNGSTIEAPSTGSSGSPVNDRVQNNPFDFVAPAPTPLLPAGSGNNPPTTGPVVRTAGLSGSGFDPSIRGRGNGRGRGRGNSGRRSFAGITRRNDQHYVAPVAPAADRAILPGFMPGGGINTTDTANRRPGSVQLTGNIERDTLAIQQGWTEVGAGYQFITIRTVPQRARARARQMQLERSVMYTEEQMARRERLRT